MSSEDKKSNKILFDLSDTFKTEIPVGNVIYFIFHVMLAFIAIYMSNKCNGGKFDLGSFIVALLCPYIYIIYILATRGSC